MFSMSRFFGATGLVLALALFGKDSTPAQEGPAQEGPPVEKAKQADDIEVLTRGPVHEAFFQPDQVKPVPGEAVPKEPPAPIPEQPPAERPEGANVEWIPGYWAWDIDRKDYTWVTGTYRNVPPGRQWVPGHWANTAEGWRWVSGFWAAEGQDEIPYTPEPPAPLETEPSLPPPNDNSTYVPGYWNYQDDRFVWRPGYYAPFRNNYFWVAPRYYWTPGGYAFCDGYWDYPLEDRGLLYAPVYFHRPLWGLLANWFFSPSYCVYPWSLYDSCFYRPFCGSFFFGNFYGHNGYRHCFANYNDFRRNHHNGAFAHQRWRNGNDPNWLGRQQRLHDDRVAGKVVAPPLTLAQQNKDGNLQNKVAVPLKDAQAGAKDRLRLVSSDAKQLDKAKSNQVRQRELSQLRNQNEKVTKAGEGTKAARNLEGRTLKLPEHLVKGTGAAKTTRKTPGSAATSSTAGKTVVSKATGGERKALGASTRSTGKSEQRGLPEFQGLGGNRPQGVVVRKSSTKGGGSQGFEAVPRPKSVTSPRNVEFPKGSSQGSGAVTRPSAPKSQSVPRSVPKDPAPRVTPSPAPKAVAPRSAPTPKAVAPRSAPAPKASAPRSAPAPRSVAPSRSPPRVSAPAPSRGRSAPAPSRGGGGRSGGGKGGGRR